MLLPPPSLATLRLLVPPLGAARYKGQAGKVAVIGGCAEYTGAPFYAAISALKVGADLSHVFCDEQAASPIKSYSPEIIVHGCLSAARRGDADIRAQADEVSRWFPSLTALVVGPGLGRDPTLQAVASLVVERAVAASLPTVIDADGMKLVTEHPGLVRGGRWVVLTPNRPEFARLLEALGQVESCGGAGVGDGADELRRATASLSGPLIVRKGPSDLLSDGVATTACDEAGCPKRSGGQGDVLAGTIATCLSWARESAARLEKSPQPHAPPMLAVYTGCLLTRRFSAAAFARHRRAMTAPDLVDAIGGVFEEFCPADGDAGQQ